MQDDRGKFYYPYPQNKRVRMYVKREEGTIWFRLYNADDDKLWDDHGWVPLGAVRKATSMYTGKGFDPNKTYDVEVARMVLGEK